MLVHGSPEVLPATFQAYIQEAATRGLSVFTAKSRLWAPSGVVLPDDLPPEVARVRGCIRVLRVLIGRP